MCARVKTWGYARGLALGVDSGALSLRGARTMGELKLLFRGATARAGCSGIGGAGRAAAGSGERRLCDRLFCAAAYCWDAKGDISARLCCAERADLI